MGLDLLPPRLWSTLHFPYLKKKEWHKGTDFLIIPFDLSFARTGFSLVIPQKRPDKKMYSLELQHW